jgi:hypothetical protein
MYIVFQEIFLRLCSAERSEFIPKLDEDGGGAEDVISLLAADSVLEYFQEKTLSQV